MFGFKKKQKPEPNDGRQEKREAMKQKSDATDALIRQIKGDRRTGIERRHDESLLVFTPDRRHQPA